MIQILTLCRRPFRERPYSVPFYDTTQPTTSILCRSDDSLCSHVSLFVLCFFAYAGFGFARCTPLGALLMDPIEIREILTTSSSSAIFSNAFKPERGFWRRGLAAKSSTTTGYQNLPDSVAIVHRHNRTRSCALGGDNRRFTPL